MNKMSYMAIGMIFTCMLSFSIISSADNRLDKNNSKSEEEWISSQPDMENSNGITNVSGNPVLIDTENNKITLFDGSQKFDFNLNSGTIIYRNNQKAQLEDLQFTDDIEVKLSSDNKVRYIIAAGEQRKTEPHPFKDLHQAKWAVNYIEELRTKDILHGYADGSFRPNQFVQKAEAIVVITRFMGLEEEAKTYKDKKVFFKDANLIEKQYPWAKGYIMAAIHHGLFEPSEDIFQPNQPASRVWVTNLLVKSLGLQSEALSQMATPPNFKDLNQIPAGSIGYINLAVKKGMINGYPDQTFKPYAKVTRAELAVLLVNANKQLPSQN